MEDKSRVSQHSTGWMAGAFAAAVAARTLVLTHFSARYSTVRGCVPPAAAPLPLPWYPICCCFS